MFDAKVICDSVAPNGRRLSTVVCTYPRFIHSEVLTHRDRARNSASSRAIPWEKRLVDGSLHKKCMKYMIVSDPVVPIVWGVEQKGMQTGGQIKNPEAATAVWLEARDAMAKAAQTLSDLGVHKSLCNRLIEPWMWITVVMSATEWCNFFRLRCHPDAEIHMQRIAGMIRDALRASIPHKLKIGEWHTPFVSREEAAEIEVATFQGMFDEDCAAVMEAQSAVNYVAAGRCARVSYLTHDGIRDWKADVELTKRLIDRSDNVIHASPLEHVACCVTGDERSGPFRGWKQLRKCFANENVEG